MFLEPAPPACRLCHSDLTWDRVENATYNQICKRCSKRISDKVHDHNLRARRMRTFGRLGACHWYELLITFDFSCAHCGRQHHPDTPITLDHIIPLSLGGTNTKFNVQPLCKHCHKIKDRTEQISPLVDSKRLRALEKRINKKRYKNGFMKWLIKQQEQKDEHYLNEVRAAWTVSGQEEHFKHFLREYTLMKWLDDRMSRTMEDC